MVRMLKIAAMTVCLAAAACGDHGGHAAAGGPDASARAVPFGELAWKYVKFHVAQLRPALAPLPAPGRIAVDDTRATRVMAPIGGRIDRVAVVLGQTVNAGDLVAVVRSADLVQLQAEQKLAETAVAAQQRTLRRIESLVQAEAAPAKDLIFAQRELREAQVAVESAMLKRRSLRVREDGNGVYDLLAPRGGVVLQLQAAVGEEVGPSRTDPLVVIADLAEVLAIASVPEMDTVNLAVGLPAYVTLTSSGDRLQGVIDRISAVVDPVRRTVDVRIRLDNAQGLLRPNTWIQVGFPAQARQMVVVPAAAVVSDDQQALVFVKSADGQLRRRLVVRGRQRDGWIELVSGLQPGEMIASEGALLLLNAVDLQK